MSKAIQEQGRIKISVKSQALDRLAKDLIAICKYKKVLKHQERSWRSIISHGHEAVRMRQSKWKSMLNILSKKSEKKREVLYSPEVFFPEGKCFITCL